MLDKILVARLHAGAALATAALLAIGGDRRTFQVSTVADRDRDLLVGDQIFEHDFGSFVFDYGSALIAVELLYFLKLSDDHFAELFLRAKNRFIFGDAFARGTQLFVNFINR